MNKIGIPNLDPSLEASLIANMKKVEELMIQDKNFENEVKDLNQKLTKTV